MMPAGKRGKLILSQFLCEAGLKSYFRHGGKVPSPSGYRQLWGDLIPVHLGERIIAYPNECLHELLLEEEVPELAVQTSRRSPVLHPYIFGAN